jgi:hypothetical protein
MIRSQPDRTNLAPTHRLSNAISACRYRSGHNLAQVQFTLVCGARRHPLSLFLLL